MVLSFQEKSDKPDLLNRIHRAIAAKNKALSSEKRKGYASGLAKTSETAAASRSRLRGSKNKNGGETYKEGPKTAAVGSTSGVAGRDASRSRRGSDMSDEFVLDEIEAELTAQYQHGYVGDSWYSDHLNHYPDLPPHAVGLWFPECLNCPCCNGFKHGCICCARWRLRQCWCTGGSGNPTDPSEDFDRKDPMYQDTSLWENDVGTIVTNTSSSEVATIGDGLQDDKGALLSDIAFGSHPVLICKASERLRNDKDVIMAAVQYSSGKAIQYASCRLRNDKEVVLATIRANAIMGIQYASRRLKMDPQVAIEAIKQDGECLKFLHPSMRGNKSFVIAAAKSKPESLKYGMGGLNQDRDCLIAAGLWDKYYDDIKNGMVRIVLSTRFSLNEESSKTATQFTVCLKAHSHIKEGSFLVYSPNAFSKESCDPKWTRFDWPCRGTFDTCQMDEALRRGAPTNACCWRYSFRHQLIRAKLVNGIMVQVVELRRATVFGKRGWVHIVGPGQRIEREMARQVGIKVFKIYQPGVYSPNLRMYVKEKAFGPNEINMLVDQIIVFHKSQPFTNMPKTADAATQFTINTPQDTAQQEVHCSTALEGDSATVHKEKEDDGEAIKHGGNETGGGAAFDASSENSSYFAPEDNDTAAFDTDSIGSVDDNMNGIEEFVIIENVDQVIQDGQNHTHIDEEGFSSTTQDDPRLPMKSLAGCYPGFSVRPPMELQHLKDKWQGQISNHAMAKDDINANQGIADSSDNDDDDGGSWLDASFSSLSWSVGY